MTDFQIIFLKLISILEKLRLMIKEAICLSGSCLVNNAGKFQGICIPQVLHFLFLKQREKLYYPPAHHQLIQTYDLFVSCYGALHSHQRVKGEQTLGRRYLKAPQILFTVLPQYPRRIDPSWILTSLDALRSLI